MEDSGPLLPSEPENSMVDELQQSLDLVVETFLIGSGSASTGASALVLCTGKHNVYHELEGSGSSWIGAGILLQCLYIFYHATLKLFSTCVRNTSSSMVRLELVLGFVFSQVLISAGRSYLGSVMRGFGLVILHCSVFVFCLPEIRGVTLCDTMDEHKEKDQLAM
ncbi:hypothetical protein SADUNF_Sadunf06G0027700 [Salix dunnii]|uniref:Uncharacterized protein n=1 Tax=Salix dunnii TaxID=1413687 RepID=A0A835JXC8_9ROSI|nr:hypothetical protein SADUNF_Sadunf06G0027700 [Salix dunnii]